MGKKFEIKENSKVYTSLTLTGGMIVGIGGVSGLASGMTKIAHKMHNTMVANPGIDYSEMMKAVTLADRAEVALCGIAITLGGALVGAAFSNEDYTISEVSPEYNSSPADGGLEKISVFYKCRK
ncbi:hypothetical protein K8R30_05070 [archaeon]|nr:hypothetical protein [archaeon]